MWLRKKKLKSLVGFHSANKIDNYNGGGGGGVGNMEEKKEKSKRIYRTSQNIRIINAFFWVIAVRVLSLRGSHSPPHLPRLLSNPLLISGPAVGATQILIWFYFCVFLPTVSTAIGTSLLSFVGALNGLLYIL